ncbi:glycerophosphotransferase [Bacillus sp. MM2020_1]|nr:glycerophosphotransferase [Bacillus sp. MM2020_1]
MKNKLKAYPKVYLIFQRIFYTIILYPRYKINTILKFVLKQLFICLPIKNNKIVITNFGGKGYGCNPKYIAEEILRQNLNYDIVWILKKELIGKVKVPSQIRIVEFGSIRHLYELATAKVWIDNERKFFYTPKRENQYYIQTWHGIAALKKIEKDIENQLSPCYITKAKNDSKMIDLLISNSRFHTELYRRTYWYDGEILEIGAPRCEILINDQDISRKVLSYFNIKGRQSILLYAPTFRANSDTAVYNVDFERLIKTLEKKYGGEWIILFRLHPDVSARADSLQYNSKILNATEYEDMNELLLASDILITDYSGCMFDFSIIKKPVFLFAPDIEAYFEERNFYFDIYSLPYPLAENNNQLQKVIEGYDKSRYLKGVDHFMKDIGIFDPKGSSSKVVKIINKVVDKNTRFSVDNKISDTSF